MAVPGMRSDIGSLRLEGKELRTEVREAIEGATLAGTIEGASTLTLELRDWDRKLLRSPMLNSRVTCLLDGLLFELVAVEKEEDGLTVTFEDAAAADLRKKKGQLTAAAGTTTRAEFAARLVREVDWLKIEYERGQLTRTAIGRGTDTDPDESSWAALQRLADEVGWRCFAWRGVVYFASDARLIASREPLGIGEFYPGVDHIDFDFDVGKPVAEATVHCRADRWSIPPGAPVRIRHLGPASGVWLVKEITRSLFSTQAEVTLVREQPSLPEPEPEPPPADYAAPADAGFSGSASGAAGAVSVDTAPSGRASAAGYAWPMNGRVSSEFGMRGGRMHKGIDIAGPTGRPIIASRDGTVEFAGYASGYGNVVYLRHSDAQTRYAHMSRFNCRLGQQVKRGQVIGYCGSTGRSTGPHVHFEVRPHGGDAINPRRVLAASKGTGGKLIPA